MGLYDNRCSLSRVSLWPDEAVLVLMEPVEKAGKKTGVQPIALGVRGTPDRGGAIDGIKSDPQIKPICKYLRAKAKSGELQLHDDEYAPQGKAVDADLIRFFQAFERNMNDGHRHTLNGRRLSFALINASIWDALAKQLTDKAGPKAWFDRVLRNKALAVEIYPDGPAKLGDRLQEQAAIESFLEKNRLSWENSEADGAQHTNDDMRQFVQEARAKFKKSPEMLKALEEYNFTLEEALSEEI